MTYSEHIERLITWLRGRGVIVHEHAFDLGHVGGQYRDETREIFLNVATAREALVTLAHEAGHWLDYAMGTASLHSYQRERHAFVYGWRILVLIGSDCILRREEYIATYRRMVAGDGRPERRNP